MGSKRSQRLTLLDLPNEILTQIVDQTIGQAVKDLESLNTYIDMCNAQGERKTKSEVVEDIESLGRESLMIVQTVLSLQAVNHLFQTIVSDRLKLPKSPHDNTMDWFRMIVRQRGPENMQAFASWLLGARRARTWRRRSTDEDLLEADSNDSTHGGDNNP